MNISLIIPTYNWPEALELSLLSTIEQSTQPNEIIIADDGSSGETKSIIKKFAINCKVPILHSWQEDKGYRLARSRNLAISKAKYEYIIVSDGDTLLHRDFIKDHAENAQKGIYLQGGRVLLQSDFSNELLRNKILQQPSFISKGIKNRPNTIRSKFLSRVFSNRLNRNLNRIRGCNFSLFKSDLINVNGFNEDFETWGQEDSEFVQRLYNAGMYRKNIKFTALQYHLYHEEGESQENNRHLLNNTIEKKLIWCKNGIDKHLSGDA